MQRELGPSIAEVPQPVQTCTPESGGSHRPPWAEGLTMCCGFWGVESCGANAVTSAATLSLRGVGWPFPAPLLGGRGLQCCRLGMRSVSVLCVGGYPDPQVTFPLLLLGRHQKGEAGSLGLNPLRRFQLRADIQTFFAVIKCFKCRGNWKICTASVSLKRRHGS